jgi:tetratricopeptide (TPR) repeat protein
VRARVVVALLCTLPVVGCASDQPPAEKASETPSTTPQSTAPTRRSPIPWEGVFTDATRVAIVEFGATGYRVSYEDASVAGWTQAYTGAAREQDGTLVSALQDPKGTRLTLTFSPDVTDQVELTTTRKGHENPRTHSLTRVDGDARKWARELYDANYPNKTVAFPKRRAKLLAKAGVAAQERKDFAQAAKLFEASAVLYRPLDANVASALHRKAICTQPTSNPEGSWTEAADLYAEAARLAERAGLVPNQALSLYNQAGCLNPKQNPDGSYDAASALYEQAAALFKQIGRDTNAVKALQAHAAMTHSWAWAHQPDRNPTASLGWETVAALYTQAAALSAATNDPAGQARSLNNLAVSLSPTVNPSGSWTRSATAHARAAIFFKAAKDEDAWRLSLRQRAVCMWQEGKELLGHSGDAATAHALFKKAHTQAKTARALELATKIKSWLDMSSQTLGADQR